MRKLHCFIAGSKDQERQREIILSVMNDMQRQWHIVIDARSFVDFDGTLSRDGQQKDYNKFIQNKANLVVFVFDHNVGDKTIEEFILAYKSLLTKKHPDILVFCNKLVIDNPKVLSLSLMMNQLQQYYIEYSTDEELKSHFVAELNKYIQRKKDLCKNNTLNTLCLSLPLLILACFVIFFMIGHLNESEVYEPLSKEETMDKLNTERALKWEPIKQLSPNKRVIIYGENCVIADDKQIIDMRLQ